MPEEYQFDRNEDAIDRMRKRPKSWMNGCIIVLNIIAFALVEVTGSSEDAVHMVVWGAAYPPLILMGEYWRLVTCMFLHFGLEHLFNNMLLLGFIGDNLERAAGRVKYLLIYGLGGCGASLISFYWNLLTGEDVISAGASGAIFAVIGAIIYIMIRNKGRLEDLSLKRLGLMAALTIYVGLTSSGVDNAAHIGGLVCGFILAVIFYRKKKA